MNNKINLLILAAAAILPSFQSVAQATKAIKLRSAGALEFDENNVLFVGDSQAAAVHAFELRPSDFTSQSGLNYGSAGTFVGRQLIPYADRKLAAFLGANVEQITINDMEVHRSTKQIFFSVTRGSGLNALPVIVKVNDGRFELLELSDIPHTSLAIDDAPTDGKLEFGQSQRSLTITDIAYWKGEIFVAGVSNEEFASKLRRASYPFKSEFATTSVEIWHAVHAQFETRAPIITHMVREVAGTEFLLAAYACTPLVRIPLSDIKPGMKIRGAMIGELGYGNTPVDMVTYTDGMDKHDYLLITHNSRNATRVSLAAIPTAKPLPVNSPNNFGPAGIEQFPMPVVGSLQLDLLDNQWAVLIRKHPDERGRVDLLTLPLPFFFDRSDHIVEMNWPDSPDPFGYKKGKK